MITTACAGYCRKHLMKTNKLERDYHYRALEYMFGHSEFAQKYYQKKQQQVLAAHRKSQQIGLKSTG